MLKRLVLCMLLGSIAAVQAEVSPYISASGGVAWMNNIEFDIDGSEDVELEMDPDFTGEAAVGIAIQSVRLELAYIWQENDSDRIEMPAGAVDIEDDATVEVQAVMVNGYIALPMDDIGNGSPVPYIFGGIGQATIDIESNEEDELAFQVGVGVGYNISEHVILDLKYRYFWTEFEDDIQGEKIEADIESNSLLLGLRCQF